jgi:hypothetical protein
MGMVVAVGLEVALDSDSEGTINAGRPLLAANGGLHHVFLHLGNYWSEQISIETRGSLLFGLVVYNAVLVADTDVDTLGLVVGTVAVVVG